MKNFYVLICSLGLTGYAFTQNVGIGNSSPSLKLHVTDTTSNIVQLTNTKAMGIGANNRIVFQTGGFYTGTIGTYATGINSARLGFTTFSTNNLLGQIERMSILDNGNIGISNMNPSYRLDVNGNVHADDNLYIDGSVGIGTISPTTKLDVAGSIKLSGNVTKTATGSALMLPFAYGKIAANGSILGGTGNFTAIRYSQGIYRISFAADVNLYNNRNLYTIIMTPDIDLISGITCVIEAGNYIEVYTFDEEPTNSRSDMNFNFLVYRSQ